jgi:hypothetical protein
MISLTYFLQPLDKSGSKRSSFKNVLIQDTDRTWSLSIAKLRNAEAMVFGDKVSVHDLFRGSYSYSLFCEVKTRE